MGAPASLPPDTAFSGPWSSTEQDQDDSEWEYEYDDTKTEDFYFTLDLSTHDAKASSTLKGLNDRQQDVNLSTERSLGSGGPADLATSHDSTIAQQASSSTKAFEPRDQLQILDLHSDNPLVKIGDALYSCKWSIELGTQVYVARPSSTNRPRRPGRVADIVGLSRVRLIGQPANLYERDDAAATEAMELDVEEPSNIEEDESVSTNTSDATNVANGPPTAERQIARFGAAREEATDPTLRAQASFLERLSLIKQKKGETDLVPFLGVKQYNPAKQPRQPYQPAESLDDVVEGAYVPGKRRAKRLKRPPKKVRTRQSSLSKEYVGESEEEDEEETDARIDVGDEGPSSRDKGVTLIKQA